MGFVAIPRSSVVANNIKATSRQRLHLSASSFVLYSNCLWNPGWLFPAGDWQNRGGG
jgi:hypothetical protein